MPTPSPTAPRGRVAVLGAGPAGMAAALGALRAGHDVVVYERYREARPAGNILNLWPPPVKALRALGVDTVDLGSPTHTEFRNFRGHRRVDVTVDPAVEREYGGGFIGLLRPQLYARLLAAIPDGVIRFNQQVDRIEQDGRAGCGPGRQPVRASPVPTCPIASSSLDSGLDRRRDGESVGRLVAEGG